MKQRRHFFCMTLAAAFALFVLVDHAYARSRSVSSPSPSAVVEKFWEAMEEYDATALKKYAPKEIDFVDFLAEMKKYKLKLSLKKITDEEVNGGKAVVECVVGVSIGKKKAGKGSMTFSLAKGKGKWRIIDIEPGDDFLEALENADRLLMEAPARPAGNSSASTYNPYPVNTGYGSSMYDEPYYPEENMFGGVNPYSPSSTYNPYPVSAGYGSPMYDETYYPEGKMFLDTPKKEDGTLDMEALNRQLELYDTYRSCMSTFTQRNLDLAEERLRLNEIYDEDRKLQQEMHDREMAFVNRQTLDQYRTANQNGLHQTEPYSDIYDDYHGNYYQIDSDGDMYLITR